MQIGVELEQIVSLLRSMGVLIQGGIMLSGIGCVSMTIVRVLSKFSRIENPDPTEWQRLWRRFFDWAFLPVGQKVVSKNRKPITNQMLFQLGIGGVVLVGSMLAFIVFSGTVIGAAVVSYHTMGTVPELAPIVEQIAAAAVLFAIAVVLYSGEVAAESLEH